MERAPWFRHYDAGVPHTLAPYPETTLLDYVADTAGRRPNHPAILFKGSTLTYGELWGRSDAFAAALAAIGVGKGDRVAVLLPNCPQFVIAQLGVWKAGGVLLPLNPLYNEEELAGPLADCEAQTIVTLTPFYPRVKKVQPRTALKRVIATNIKEHLPPSLRLLFTVFKEKKEGHRIRLQPGDLWLGDLIKAHALDPSPKVSVDPGDMAMILLSGGTTGTPKGVIALHGALAITALQVHAWYKPLAEEWIDTILLPLPLFHAFGSVATLPLAFLGRHPLALVPNPRDLDDVLATIRRVRPAFFVGVPTLYNALLNHRKVKAGEADFRSLKLCVSGATPLLGETRKRFEELTGGRIVEGYSMTEALVASVSNPLLGVKKPGSVGVPLSDVEMRIVDAEGGEREMATGEVGEVLLRAPQIMPGYWRNPEETAQALRSHGDGAPWLHTGDLGYLDSDSYLFLVDRKKDLIKISGLQVWPREIEEAIASHPAVAEVGVAGVPDLAKGEVAKAWVVTRARTSASAEEIRAHCKERLAPYKVPAQVEFRSELPKSMVGKVLRRALVAEHRARERAAPEMSRGMRNGGP